MPCLSAYYGEKDRNHLLFFFFLNFRATTFKKVAVVTRVMMLTSSLPIELRDDFAHSLGSAGGSGNDVLVGTAAITPGLAAGAIHCLLGGCVCMDCSL